MKDNRKITFIFLILYISWSWIFYHSVFASSAPIFLSLFLLIFLYGNHTYRYIGGKIDSSTVACLPFFIYMSFCYFFQLDFEHLLYWMIASSILLTAHKTCMIDKFPHALMIIIGLVTTAGVLVQWLLPDFYDSNINPLLVYEMLDQWDEAEIGLNGFTYQLGHTSRLIVLGLIVLLFVGDKFKLFANYRILKLLFIFAMMISIFLTSKRMNAAIGLLILVMYYLFYNPSKSYKHYLSLIAFLIVLGLGGNYLVTNAALLLDSPLLGRIAATVMEFSGGQEISSSGRDYIWKQAMLYYNEHPMLGIGISNFKKIEGISVHNTYIQMLCEGGILGFTLMIIPFVWCFISSVKRCLIDKKTRYYPYLLLSLAFQLNFIIEGITDNTIENSTGFIIYAFAISILVDYKNRYNLCKMEEDKRINI